MILILGFISLLFTGILIVVYQDIKVPPVLLGIEFSVLYFLEFLIGYELYAENALYSYFFVGVFVFSLGYYIFNKCHIVVFKITSSEEKEYEYNVKLVNLILIFVDLYAFYELIRMYDFARNNYIDNYFTTIHRLYIPDLLLGRIRLCIYSLTVITAIIYFVFKKKVKLTFFHSFILSIVLALMTTGRAQVLLPLIGVFIVWLYGESHLNYKAVFKILGCVILFFAFFFYTATLKYSHLVGENLIEFFGGQVKVYLCSSMPAFLHWARKPIVYLYGKNTFRFLFALAGMKENTVSIAQEFVNVGELQTNVYTIYQFYAKDFGLLYALIIQFLIGGFYAFLNKYSDFYKGRSRSYFIYFGLYALLFYALAMQYGGDSYLALLSTWIQLTFWLWLFSRKWILKET